MTVKTWFACATSILVLYPVVTHAEETLEQAWSDAYNMNPSLQAQRANLRVTDEQVSQALSHWRPSVDATGNVGRTWQRVPGLDIFGTGHFASETHGAGVQVTQPVFRGFRTLAETEAAEKQVLAERARLEHAEQQLFVDTATAFFDLVRDLDILEDERDNVQVLKQKLEEARIRHQHGDLTQTDIRQAEARLARADVSRLQAESSVTADRASYQRLVGHMPGTLSAAKFSLTIPQNLDDTLAQTLHNPDVIAAQYNTEEAKAEVRLNEGSLLPEINIVGNSGRNWGQSSTIPGREDSSQVLLQATIPLYRSGADYSRTRAAEQMLTQKKMELEEAEHKATENARHYWQSLIAANASFAADKEEVDANAQALEGVKVESKVGTRTTLDVLNAQQELLDAKIDLAKAQHDRQLAMVEIKAAIGELTANRIKLPVKYYDPVHHYDDVKGKWIGFSKNDADYQVPASK